MNSFEKQADNSSFVAIGSGNHFMVRIYRGEHSANVMIPCTVHRF